MAKATNVLRIGPGLSLDADYLAGRSLALLGKRGAGKTYTCRVLAEELVAAHVQTVIVDPMGVFWGLRSSANGQRTGLPIPVFGGEHGDAPLESSAGALMADLAVQEGLSMVLDLSGFGSRTQERTFAAAFFDRLYRRNRDLLHLIVDEADLFAPQKPRNQDAPLLVTMENIVRRGRNKGIGVTLASQRAAVINKDVLTQVDILAAMRVAAPQDRDAVREWVRGQGDENVWAEIAPSLPGLASGESWWWAPEKGILERVQVRAARTFDSSPTRERGVSARTPKTFADVDMSAISDRIAATVERAKASDPKELARQVSQLRRDLTRAQAQTSTPGPPPPEVVVEVAVVPPEAARALTAAEHEATKVLTGLRSATEAAQALLGQVRTASAATKEAGAPASRTVSSTQARPPQADAPQDNGPGRADSGGDALSPARLNLLIALASLETVGITAAQRTQLALWARVSPKSSGYANNLGALRSAGLIDYPGPARVSLTDPGRALVDPASVTSPTSEGDLHEHVRGLVSPARWRLVEQLIAAHPESLDKEGLAGAAQVSPVSSGYANNLGALRSMGLIDYPSPGLIALTPAMLLEPSQLR